MPQPNLVVTGFGKFHGVENNPSEWIVSKLALEQRDGNGGSHASYDVLEVSAQAVRQKLEWQAREAEAGGAQTIWVHIGVDDTATGFKLERQAFNEADFRVPDEAGWCPQHEPIDTAHSLQHTLVTALPVDDLAGALRSRHEVQVSSDAGRFVCNWTLYKSLQQCQEHKCSSDVRWQAVFVHVPSFRAIEARKQLAFARELLQLLSVQPAEGTGGSEQEKSADSAVRQARRWLQQRPVQGFSFALMAWLAFKH